MRILVLDSTPGRCAAAVFENSAAVASRVDKRERGLEAVLPEMARAVLLEAEAMASGGGIGLIGVTTGPGSFTCIRAGLALAHGIGLARGIPVVGVSVGQAMAFSFPHPRSRPIWTVTPSRRGHVFLERDDAVLSVALESLPVPTVKVAIAGGAAKQVAALLAARGADVMLTDARFPSLRGIAEAAARRRQDFPSANDAQPLYVDPPEAKPPSGGPRPPPVAA